MLMFYVFVTKLIVFLHFSPFMFFGMMFLVMLIKCFIFAEVKLTPFQNQLINK